MEYTIPNFNPEDVVNDLQKLMRCEREMVSPWWCGYTGPITKTGDGKWLSTGIVKKINSVTVEITELPIHRWADKYKAELES